MNSVKNSPVWNPKSIKNLSNIKSQENLYWNNFIDFLAKLTTKSLCPRCLDKFCDPSKLDRISVPDMMICAPWDTEVFSCLADGRDHTPCCAAKDIPPVCQVSFEWMIFVLISIKNYIYLCF